MRVTSDMNTTQEKEIYDLISCELSDDIDTINIEDTDHHITVEQLKRVMPSGSRANITEELVKEINDILDSTPLRVNYRDNLLSYTGVLQDAKYKLKDYLKAVMYVSYKLMGDSNVSAYTKTHPERYQQFIEKGYNSKIISSHVAGYHSSLLVTKILQQSMVPSWILNQDLYQKALNTQADLMINAKSEKVRTDAANSLLTQLKMPEATKVSLDVSVKEDDSIKELRRNTLELARQQRLMIESGAMNAREIANSRIITDITDVEYEEINE